MRRRDDPIPRDARALRACGHFRTSEVGHPRPGVKSACGHNRNQQRSRAEEREAEVGRLPESGPPAASSTPAGHPSKTSTAPPHRDAQRTAKTHSSHPSDAGRRGAAQARPSSPRAGGAGDPTFGPRAMCAVGLADTRLCLCLLSCVSPRGEIYGGRPPTDGGVVKMWASEGKRTPLLPSCF